MLRDDEPCRGEAKSHQKGRSPTSLLGFHMSPEEGATLPLALKIEMSAQRDEDRERRKEISGEGTVQNGGEICR
jgi:hypothetical protein